MKKLSALGFSSTTKDLINDYLFHRYQLLKIKSHFSDWLQTIKGVQQGTVLGPLIYLLYVNEFQHRVKNIEHIQFADDTMIFTSAKTVEQAVKKLETLLKTCSLYFEENQLTINKAKTQFMVLSPSKTSINTTLKFDEANVNSVQSVKYLGVNFDSKLTYDDEVKKILRRMAMGIKTMYTLRNIFPIKTRKVLYQTLVMSHLEYSSVLLTGISEKLLQSLQKQQNWALKQNFSKRKNQPYE